MANGAVTERGPDTPFEEAGSLNLAVFEAIRARLSRAGYHNPRQQSDLLARELDCADAAPLWSLLMWNTPAELAVRQRLAGWIERGMPIPAAARRGI
jgi:hypothetical protein